MNGADDRYKADDRGMVGDRGAADNRGGRPYMGIGFCRGGFVFKGRGDTA
ncbi:MAG: hypothetical protein FWH01_02450 [Oscillospiraceae bacterium]|nr:hypothetical protein [Oscillospiraceae bacterium]